MKLFAPPGPLQDFWPGLCMLDDPAIHKTGSPAVERSTVLRLFIVERKQRTKGGRDRWRTTRRNGNLESG
jgi:hypothetical protein